jgi:hypothetical protein
VNPSDVFDAATMRRFHESAQSSASQIVPYICKYLQPESVIDVGCCLGAWTSRLKAAGVPVVQGIDGDWAKDHPEQTLKGDDFIVADLRCPINLKKRYDLAICLEVGEHLPEARAGVIVKTLTTASDTILFSAATPNQGGTFHINEKHIQWWEEKFSRHNYRRIGPVGARFSGNTDVNHWYIKNTQLYVKAGSTKAENKAEQFVQKTDPSLVDLISISPRSLAPFIISCEGSLEVLSRFVDTFLAQDFNDPVITIDVTRKCKLSSRYISEIDRLCPRAVYAHSTNTTDKYEHMSEMATTTLKNGLAEMSKREKYCMFIEDDCIFSSQFCKGLQQLPYTNNTGVWSFYRPHNYEGLTIPRDVFWASLCYVFPEQPARMLVTNYKKMMGSYGGFPDVQWPRFLYDSGYILRATANSYIEHGAIHSRLSNPGHVAKDFLP